MRRIVLKIFQVFLAHIPALAAFASFVVSIQIFKLDLLSAIAVFACIYFATYGVSKLIQFRLKLLPQDILKELGISVRSSSNLMGSLENFSVNSNKQAIISQEIGKHLAEVSRAAQDILEKAKETSECSVKSQAAAADGGASVSELLEFLRQVIESNQTRRRCRTWF